MPAASDFDRLNQRLALWQSYDPVSKADLFSTALETDSGLFVIDPIALATEAKSELIGFRPVVGIIVTNENHHRDSQRWGKSLTAPIFAHAQSGVSAEGCEMRELHDGDHIHQTLRVIALEGAPLGEIALYDEVDGGTMIVGDALINFGSHGFDLLPAKYCVNAKQMRRSLRKLLDFKFERLLFAHGLPILQSAREKLETLLRGAN